MEFSSSEYWCGWPFPPPGDLPNPGIKPRSPALQADALPFEPPRQLSIIIESSVFWPLWSTGEGSGKPLQYSCLENPMNSMKRQKDRTLKDDTPRSVGAQYASGDQWRNNSRKNEETEPKQKLHPVVHVTGDGSKVRCYKEQYCIGTWNVRSMNQGKLEVVKQKMAGVNTDI